MLPSPVSDRWYHVLSEASSMGTSSSSHVMDSPQVPESGVLGALVFAVSGRLAACSSVGSTRTVWAGQAKASANENISRRLTAFFLFFMVISESFPFVQAQIEICKHMFQRLLNFLECLGVLLGFKHCAEIADTICLSFLLGTLSKNTQCIPVYLRFWNSVPEKNPAHPVQIISA